MSRILVSGGCGFIGSHVIDALLKLDHVVMAIDDLSSGSIVLVARSNFHFRRWDILDLKLMDVIFHNFEPEYVIHLAAQPSIQESWKAADRDAKINILGTINLLGLCQRYKVKRFVFASTSAVCAPKEDGMYHDNDKIGPLTPYGVSKAAAERYIQISGLSYAILRLGNVYGPGQVPLGENQLIPRALAHIYQGKDFVINGDGKQKRDFVYVKDVADAFVKAVESDVDGTFNVAMGLSWKVFDALEIVRLHAGFDKPFLHGPEQKGELRNVMLPSHFAYNKFGWKAETPLMTGIEETVKAWPK